LPETTENADDSTEANRSNNRDRARVDTSTPLSTGWRGVYAAVHADGAIARDGRADR
jgi:hypothetical protein